MTNTKERLASVDNTLKTFGKFNPKGMKNFKGYMDAVKKDGTLSTKMKNIIGVAVSIARQCEFCVPFYVKQALDNGATKEELIEAGMVAGLLGGGPAIMFSKHLFDALEELGK
ncbi:MAG: carboxymuconolactone decarboxylase family protein [Candidatus Lokiarchaeota archaeon]|nr:carboxymuconolactone decarboxylase family protein [Candidatus Lokiarchaeota archaeon]MBD3342230.1 carboxymuconolactone decarboxylase family protein [Candidatus Lokiarchaeota archaeon]